VGQRGIGGDILDLLLWPNEWTHVPVLVRGMIIASGGRGVLRRAASASPGQRDKPRREREVGEWSAGVALATSLPQVLVRPDRFVSPLPLSCTCTVRSA